MNRDKLMYILLGVVVAIMVVKSLLIDPMMLTTPVEYKSEIATFNKVYEEGFGNKWWSNITNSRIVKITDASESQITAAKRRGVKVEFGHKATYRVYLLYLLPVREYEIIK